MNAERTEAGECRHGHADLVHFQIAIQPPAGHDRKRAAIGDDAIEAIIRGRFSDRGGDRKQQSLVNDDLGIPADAVEIGLGGADERVEERDVHIVFEDKSTAADQRGIDEVRLAHEPERIVGVVDFHFGVSAQRRGAAEHGVAVDKDLAVVDLHAGFDIDGADDVDVAAHIDGHAAGAAQHCVGRGGFLQIERAIKPPGGRDIERAAVDVDRAVEIVFGRGVDVVGHDLQRATRVDRDDRRSQDAVHVVGVVVDFRILLDDGVADLADAAVAQDAAALKERGAGQPQLRAGIARWGLQNRARRQLQNVFDDTHAFGANDSIQTDAERETAHGGKIGGSPLKLNKSAGADAAAVVEHDFPARPDRHPAGQRRAHCRSRSGCCPQPRECRRPNSAPRLLVDMKTSSLLFVARMTPLLVNSPRILLISTVP